MRRSKEDAAKTRQAVLDAALAVFSQKGYEATRLQDIAEVAGVTRGAVYHHFGSKPDLFVTLFQEASAQASAGLERAIAEGGPFAEVLRRALVYSFSLLEDDRRFREVMALTLFKTAASPELVELSRIRYAQARTQVEEVAEYFRAGVAQGELRPDLDPVAAARALLAYQNGLALLWLSNTDAFSIKESAPTMAELFLRGVVAG